MFGVFGDVVGRPFSAFTVKVRHSAVSRSDTIGLTQDGKLIF